MGLIAILKGLTVKAYRRRESVFSIDVGKQQRYVRQFPEPRDDCERSYFQYKCQMKRLPIFLVALQNLGAALLLPVYYVKLLCTSETKADIGLERRAVFFSDGISTDIIPDELIAEYGEIIGRGFAEEMLLDAHARGSWGVLFRRYWFSPFFVFKCLVKVGMYAAQIRIHAPQAIISYSEYSFTSSFLTGYCESRGVEHINVMHGEKLINFRDVFLRYSRYYVWDEHYVALMTELRADRAQFRIAVPRGVKIEVPVREARFRYTYYLGVETADEMVAIRTALRDTGTPDAQVCIRYHPRYCIAEEVRRVFSTFEIESPAEVPLAESFANTHYAVSLFSTVLYQAYASGKPIVIDDVSDPVKYARLQELRFILLMKPHVLLSRLLQRDPECAT